MILLHCHHCIDIVATWLVAAVGQHGSRLPVSPLARLFWPLSGPSQLPLPIQSQALLSVSPHWDKGLASLFCSLSSRP